MKGENTMIRPPAAQTNCMREVYFAAHYAQSCGDISLIYGEAGLGKTFSLRQYARENNVIYIGLTEQWEKARKPLKILGKTGVMR